MTLALQSPTAWTTTASRAVLIARDDIDTDQIIPARFLTTTSRTGLGVHCFADWRYDDDGAPRADFPLNTPIARTATILVAGHNFGCGSSREHAPWSLLDSGFRAVIAGSFADIFRSNAHRNGLLTIALGERLAALQTALRSDTSTTIRIDLASQTVVWGDGEPVLFSIDAFAKRALLEGLDELALLATIIPEIEQWESQHGRGHL